MYLIQILLPLADNAGKRFPGELFRDVQEELTERFKGMTAYSRAPAEGIWKPRQSAKREEIIVHEVMTPKLDRSWWKQYRKRLEKNFRQESILIRASAAILL